jgi:hypothetical protein
LLTSASSIIDTTSLLAIIAIVSPLIIEAETYGTWTSVDLFRDSFLCVERIISSEFWICSSAPTIGP